LWNVKKEHFNMIDNPMDTHWILTRGFDDGWFFLHRFLALPHRRASSSGYSQPAPFLMKPQKAEKTTPVN